MPDVFPHSHRPIAYTVFTRPGLFEGARRMGLTAAYSASISHEELADVVDAVTASLGARRQDGAGISFACDGGVYCLFYSKM